MTAVALGHRMIDYLKRNRFYVLAAALQLAMFPFGLWYDTRIFFGTGAGVAHGLSPYLHYNLGDYYTSPSLVGVVSGIGYAPPWALFLAAVYSVAYVPTGQPLVLNLAIKLPIIAGNLLLARFVRQVLEAKGCSPAWASRAELLVLFNPFLLYTSTLWNMFDTLVALLMMASLYAIDRDRGLSAGLLMGLSVSLKHLALPLIPLEWLWIARRPWPAEDRVRQFASFTSGLLGVVIALVFLPFYLFGWQGSGFVAATTYQTVATGGFTIYNSFPVDLSTPSLLSVLGYIPFIAVLAAYVLLWRRPLRNFVDLTQFALIILIVFMTTRTFVAEQNLAVIFPLILLPELLLGRGFRESNQLWIVFLVYTVWNSFPTQFPFLVLPGAFDITVSITTDPIFGAVRGVILYACVLAWLFLGWKYVLRRT